MRKIHEVKTWLRFYDDLVSGIKSFDIREDDRGYRLGDIVEHRKFDPSRGRYTGEHSTFQIVYLIKTPFFGLQDGYCVMGLKSIPVTECECSCTHYVIPRCKDAK